MATVKTHVNRILTKLQARDRVHLVILGYEHGMGNAVRRMISPPEQREL